MALVLFLISSLFALPSAAGTPRDQELIGPFLWKDLQIDGDVSHPLSLHLENGALGNVVFDGLRISGKASGLKTGSCGAHVIVFKLPQPGSRTINSDFHIT